jgi:asparagine synthase (glutamine-hydrolysing)
VTLPLSGGVDSSAVAGIIAELSREDCKGFSPLPLPTCFAIACPGDEDVDESAIAARTAEYLCRRLW